MGWFLQRLWVKFLPRIVVSWGAKLPGKKGHCEIEVLKDVKFDITVARFGLAGRFKPWQIAPMFIDVDDVPVDDYAKKGIVVFNTPGANANGVKEMVFAAMLLASRDIVGGIECNGGDGDFAKLGSEK